MNSLLSPGQDVGKGLDGREGTVLPGHVRSPDGEAVSANCVTLPVPRARNGTSPPFTSRLPLPQSGTHNAPRATLSRVSCPPLSTAPCDVRLC